MVKNVIVVSDYGYIEGGAGRIAHETAILLSKNGYNVVFFCAVPPVSEELQNASLEVVCLEQADILHESRIKGVRRGLRNKEAQKGFRALLRRFDKRETVIHVHTWTKALSSVIFKEAERAKFQVLVTVHDYFLVCPNGGLFNYKKRKICELKPMSAKCFFCNCDARSYPQKLFRVLRQKRQNRNVRRNKYISYAFISEFSKQVFLSRYNKIPQERQYYLPNVVNFAEERERIKCEKNDVYLFIGGLTEVKGIRIFCEAVTKANVSAVVIGEGILRKELEQKYPNINFVGWKSKEEMMPYLRQTRCLIFPSVWYETMGLVPLEVRAYGIPVICSSLNAASEYVPPELLYDGTIQGLIEKLGSTLSDNNISLLSAELFERFDDDYYGESNYLKNVSEIYEGVF
jgi:glycosyltransferase involved in cell wall biosynthesis